MTKSDLDHEVDFVLANDQYSLQGRLLVNLPGLDNITAQTLVNAAHATCPYSKVTRGSIDLAITVNTES